MRTTQLVTSYISAALFLLLGVRCTLNWLRQRDKTAAHLALATALFGISTIISAISATVYDSTKLETPPHWLSAVSSIISFLAIYGFLVFLGDFVRFHAAIRGLFALATVAAIVFAIIEEPDLRFDPARGLVKIQGVHNPVNYKTYIGTLLIYYAIVLAILWISFFVNALRLSGLARLRMMLIAAGFFLLFVVVGLLPRLLFGGVSPKTVSNVLRVAEWVAIVSAPLLLVGFSPPRWLSDRYSSHDS
ncbi:MAG: hypothetical protein ACXVES_03730 [Actinomycetota bacterium]